MKQLLVLFVTQLISFYSWSQNPNPSPTLNNFILNEMSLENIPGASTLIIKNGQIVWRESFGMADIDNNKPVTENTIFMLASISKLFAGTALMTLADNGTIDLDDSINDYLPFSIQVPGFTETDITFRMLMTHTASIEDNETFMDNYYSTGDPTISLATVIQQYFDINGSDYSATGNFHAQQAGTFYDYSNIGTALAGYMVEAVTGISFDEYCQTHIFDLLDMDNSSWFLNGLDINKVAVPYAWQGGQFVAYDQYGFADYPNGQLRLDILDLANFMIAFLQDGTFGSDEILSSHAVDEMLTLQVPNLDATQGLNWYQENIQLSGGGTIPLWGHNGGEDGVSTDMYINPDNGIGVAVLTNGEGDNSFIIDELYDYALGLSTPLAVELTSFAVQTNHQTVQLDWKTTTETNHKGFEIEHSIDGNNWQYIGFIKGNNNSTNWNDYQFHHSSPIVGFNYYRLKQIDKDGVFEYSAIKTIEWLTNEWSIYPNPVKNEAFALSISDINFTSGQVLVFNSIGQLLQSQQISHRQTNIQTSTLPKGIYTVVLEYNGQKNWKKLIIQ